QAFGSASLVFPFLEYLGTSADRPDRWVLSTRKDESTLRHRECRGNHKDERLLLPGWLLGSQSESRGNAQAPTFARLFCTAELFDATIARRSLKGPCSR